MKFSEVEREAAERRREAARRHRPEHVKVLLVAEAPPALVSRYFYFEDVEHHDGLFWDVVKAFTGEVRPDPREKAAFLAELMALGVFLIDLKEDPTDPRPLAELVDPLIERCRELRPERIIIVKPEVFDLSFIPLRHAGLPVINRRIPFPSTGNQLQFASAFSKALKQSAPSPFDET